jgi:hypothetical protein
MARIAWVRGSLPADVSRASRIAAGGDAQAFSSSLQDVLIRFGWSLERERRVADRGDGRHGRVDLIATKDRETVAIELDRYSARRKSIIKLGQVPSTCQVIIVRGK